MARVRIVPTIAALAAALAIAAPAWSQTPQLPASPVPDSVRQLLVEFQRVRQQLAEIQDATLEADSALREERAAVQGAVEAAMIEEDPGVKGKLERLKEIGGELRTARAQRDTARMRRLIEEVGHTQRELQQAQAAAMRRDGVARQVAAYHEHLLAAMRTHDPRTNGLLERLESLARRLEAAAPR
ncbi:MAG TPA: hypothetical protein VF158_07185 [Longimicrobiales bacterium]